VPGASAEGIAEDFPLAGVRTLYGATKLAGELLLAEYAALGVEHVTTRFGVIAGPGQMGKVDQGVFALWMSRYVFGGALRYQGWGGAGKQVRDVLHIDDACDLLLAQLGAWPLVQGRTWNAGGGLANSLSLAETTALCEEITGTRVPLTSDPATHPSDVRVFITDHRALTAALGWQPSRSARVVLEDLHRWMTANAAMLAPVFGG
jgi:CDP-paratose 2-epimerase